jgi:predicted enzyme related to lactoylglutathione lyase
MPMIATHAHGAFSWVELCSADIARATAFYGGLFDWTMEELAMSGGSYYIFRLNGDEVAGMYQTTAERLAAGVRPHWNLYASVSDVDAAVSRAKELGGALHGEVFEGGGDRIATLKDAEGNTICIAQRTGEPYPVKLGEVHAFCWGELATRNLTAAKAFYEPLFGWTITQFHGGPMPYNVINLPGQEMGIGGVFEMTAEMPGDPHWVPYFMDTEGAEFAVIQPQM